MSEFVAYLTVFVAAAIPWLEVLFVVPAGILAGLPPVETAVVGAAGNIASLVPLVIGGDRIRTWWRRRRDRRTSTTGPTAGPTAGRSVSDATTTHVPDGETGRGGRARRLFDRFGLPGLALLGPLLTGVHLAALVGLAAGSLRRPTLLWMMGGVVLWSALAAVATVVGLEAFVDPDALPDLFSAL